MENNEIEFQLADISPLEKILVQAYMAGLMDGHRHRARPTEFVKKYVKAIDDAFRAELSFRRNQFSKHPITPILDEDNI